MDESIRVYNIQLQIDSRLEHVRLLSSALRGIGQELELTSKQVDHLELILVEAVNNVIKHAYDYHSGNHVKVCVECAPGDSIKLIISDKGKPMPETASRTFNAGDINFPEPGQLPESGWGMGLINILADSFYYERKNDQNYWHVLKRLV